jgi:hypothetical protein
MIGIAIALVGLAILIAGLMTDWAAERALARKNERGDRR